MKYRLLLKPTAYKQIKGLDPQVARRIVNALLQLQEEPRPPGAARLRGTLSGYRIRVGNWRILYTIDDEVREVQVYRIRHRREAYR